MVFLTITKKNEERERDTNERAANESEERSQTRDEENAMSILTDD